MMFTTFSFILFTAAVLLLYWLLPGKYRTPFLLLASYYFYSCYDIKYLFFLLFSTLSTYGAGLLMERLQDKPRSKKSVLILTLLANLSLLLVFKYLTFFGSVVQQVLDLIRVPVTLTFPQLLLPVGISFYTFQIIGYLADVYNGKTAASHDLSQYALYVAYFPKIMQGPIENSANFLVQLKEKRCFSYEKFVDSFTLLLIGYFKKTVLADRFAVPVDTIYGNLASYDGFSYLLAAFFYSLQIYCDFSGYTDIARGVAGLMGYDLLENFSHPYLAGSIRDFWRRWHASLTKWFTTYIYIPLGGNRKGIFRWALNIMIVFLVSGLWHGAAFTFVIWGLIHGLYQLIGKFTRAYKDKLLAALHISKSGYPYRICSVVCTFCLVMFAWIFFRAPSLTDAFTLIRGIFSFRFAGFDLMNLGMCKEELIFSFCMVPFLFVMELFDEKKNLIVTLSRQRLPVRWLVYYILIFTIIMFGIYGDLSAASFLYFQF